MLRRIDKDLWAKFRARAIAEGVSPTRQLLRLMAAYLNTTPLQGAPR